LQPTGKITERITTLISLQQHHVHTTFKMADDNRNYLFTYFDNYRWRIVLSKHMHRRYPKSI